MVVVCTHIWILWLNCLSSNVKCLWCYFLISFEAFCFGAVSQYSFEAYILNVLLISMLCASRVENDFLLNLLVIIITNHKSSLSWSA
jgi:hypothetical protein